MSIRKEENNNTVFELFLFSEYAEFERNATFPLGEGNWGGGRGSYVSILFLSIYRVLCESKLIR